MILKPMRYKDYVWPHNPRTYEISYERKIAVDKVPFGRYIMKNLGMTYRELRGEGEFVGAGAYDEFKKLASVFYEESPGVLVHPVWQSSNAYFVELSLKQEPTENYVSYAFEFWEDSSRYSGGLKPVTAETKTGSTRNTAGSGKEKVGTYTVVSGDTLWAIAGKFGVALNDLIAANGQIKNPNLIHPGDKITIPEAGK